MIEPPVLQVRAGRSRALAILVFGLALALAAGCAPSPGPARSFSEMLGSFPDSADPLRIVRLTPAATVPEASRGKMVIVLVHPAYSLFFREELRNRYSDAKYELLKFQLESETRFLRGLAGTGHPVVLVLPGNYEQESAAPLAYTYYLNEAAGGSRTVFHVFSETSSSGALPTETMVTLYSFLRNAGARTVLVGGGYIGRCQREFYNQLVTYADAATAYVVPEISAISPDDISDRDAHAILEALRTRDYAPVRSFIEKRTRGTASVLFLPETIREGAAAPRQAPDGPAGAGEGERGP